MHVAEIKKTYKGKVLVSTYLRRTFREDGKVKHETVANISDLPDDLIAEHLNPFRGGARCRAAGPAQVAAVDLGFVVAIGGVVDGFLHAIAHVTD